MSKKQFKSQASSGRAGGGFGPGFGGFGSSQSSVLSYIQEPLDFSAISDANVVIAFKNLSKKDAVTRTKALEDLQGAIAVPNVHIEDGTLDAWAKVFPRLSIDNARRVRYLAHVLNGHVCAKCGKRTVKHLPRVAGPWLAGTFDSDRAAARAAGDALSLVFPTAEKLRGVRKAFQRSIIEHCRDAALYETSGTLSDERTVSADDALATHARVVATSISVVSSLLVELTPAERSNEHEIYTEIFAESKLWECAHHADTAVRRSMHKLVQACLQTQLDLIEQNLKPCSTAYLYKGLNSDQTGSSQNFVEALDALTSTVPSIWTDAYSGKKPATTRLRHFLKQGSQSAGPSYWDSLQKLLQQVPQEVLPQTSEELKDLLAALRSGVSKKEERFNTSNAWAAYFTFADIAVRSLADDEAQPLLREQVLPVVQQFLFPSHETSEWTITGARADETVSKCARIQSMPLLLVDGWPEHTEKLIELARASHPEQSKDFDKSQTQVASTGERFCNLQRQFLNADVEVTQVLHGPFVKASNKLLSECMSLLESRRGKPYGAAAIVEKLLSTSGDRLLEESSFKASWLVFADKQITSLIFSASQQHLVHSLFTSRSLPEFASVFQKLVQTVLDANEPVDSKLDVFRSCFPNNTPPEVVSAAKDITELQEFFEKSLSAGRAQSFADLVANLIKLEVVSVNTTDAVLANLTKSLSIEGEAKDGLAAIDQISAADRAAVQAFMSKQGGSGEHLLPSVLRLERSTDDSTAERATNLASKLSTAIGESSSDTKFSIVLQNLLSVSESSMTMDALNDLTDRLVGPEHKIENASDMLPSDDTWLSALQAVVKRPLPSLALHSPLQGAVHLVQPNAEGGHAKPSYDGEGLSQALRISMYFTRLLAQTDLLDRLAARKATVLALLHVSVLMTEDNMSVLGAQGMWHSQGSADLEHIALDFISEATKVLRGWWDKTTPELTADESSEYVQFMSALEKFRGSDGKSLALAYYTYLSSTKTNSNLFEIHGFSSEQTKRSEEVFKEQRSAKSSLSSVASASGLQQPLAGTQTLKRWCNELVADLTDIDAAGTEQQALEKTVLLNVILTSQDDTGIAKQRIMFLVKRILLWLESDVGFPLKAEGCKALVELFFSISDMFGEHWERALSFMVSHWTSEDNTGSERVSRESWILLTHASLKLFATFKKLTKEDEPNDDLVDAMKEKHKGVYAGLIQLLTSANGVSDESHQPLMITHELLARQIASLPLESSMKVDELYPLLYTPSLPIQHATFDLLHKQIPAAQEEISVNAALDNKPAQLPDELLSLLLESPTLESLADARFDRTMPLSLQGYLFSWRLIFDHFDGSSYKVKSDYIEQLKDGAYLPGLLTLTFDFLGHTNGRPVDASKFDVLSYTPGVEPSPERDVQWLLTHLCFLALTNLPSLAKSYYLDMRSRQTSSTVESWTAKHISPLIISTSLQSVADWSAKSVKEDPEYEKMTVKVGVRSKEVNVGYLVDEQLMAIKVILPDAYPLASAQVVGVSRVAVKEEKWQSWLRNCQGVITFSNGSITDGLAAWRRNVTGALKGQSECSICYSIISADKQLPTKRCPTCKHLFHSGCLFKWFKSSNASTCPLCRNPFNFN